MNQTQRCRLLQLGRRVYGRHRRRAYSSREAPRAAAVEHKHSAGRRLLELRERARYIRDAHEPGCFFKRRRLGTARLTSIHFIKPRRSLAF